MFVRDESDRFWRSKEQFTKEIMRFMGQRFLAFSVFLGLCSFFAAGSRGESIEETMERERREAAAARAKDKAWKAATKEVGLIRIGEAGNPGAVKNYCLNAEGDLLVCYAGSEQGVRVYSPEGKLKKTLRTEIKPTAIAAGKDGSIFIAGEGRVFKLDAAGKVLASAASPVADAEVAISKEVEEMVKEMCKESRQPVESELSRMKTMLENRRSDVTGLAATDQDVFMAVPAPTDFTYRIYRFDNALQAPKLVVEKLRGCCGQMDVQAHDGKMWIPHNARHAVENLDREGKPLGKFGKSGKVKASDFGGCCEPKSIRVLANGDILAAESGPPTCIKRFSADGKFKEVVALVEDTKGDCVRVTVDMSPDGSKYYMLDTTRDAIRVFSAAK